MIEQPAPYHLEAPAPHTQILNLFILTENCLQDCYRLDQKSIAVIMCKLNPLLEDVNEHSIIHDFIEKSNALNIQFSEKIPEATPPPDDAVSRAPKWHEVLFESPYVRVLWADSMPGDKEPFHTHHWKSIMVIIQAGEYEIKNSDGSIESGLWPIGVYELPAETSPSAYTNIGKSEFRALRFEIKE